MTDGSPLKHVVCFAFPLMLGNICQQIYTLTDTAVVGRVLGVAALAALGACDLLVWMTGSAIQAFTEGFSIRMAACFGRGSTIRRPRRRDCRPSLPRCCARCCRSPRRLFCT